MNKTVTCNKCGWVSYQVSREFAINETDTFNKYFETLTKEQKELYFNSKNAVIEFYEYCHCCGGSYKNFRDSVENDCPEGVTLNPIINKDE